MEANKLTKDPVCGMTVRTEKPSQQARFEGKTFYFCSHECKAKFDSNPKQFASHAA